ncbi:MAG: Cys-tRNA(Pro) deacylase, partial [Oscillospiraceae bacterium]|nr:Cys-tRNA(Pro) deacylase [Oscillospiraceae bacterium]
MSKEVKTNAMRMLDKMKIPYEFLTYECGSFEDGVQVAKMLGQSPDVTFKTLVTVGKSAKYYVFVLPVDKEMDLKKCARTVGEKSLEPVHVKDIQGIT